MANVTTSIQTTIGSSTVNNQVIPFMRAREIDFRAENLRPDRLAHFFFGDVNVDNFTQRGSKLVPDNANIATTIYGTYLGEGSRLYCNTTHAFATVITGSNNAVYINENYLSVNISPIGANSLGATDYVPGSIVYQGPNTSAAVAGNATFEGQVVYYNNADKVLTVYPLLGHMRSNSTSTANTQAWLYLSGGNKVVSANNPVIGNKFPLNAPVYDLEIPSVKFLVSQYDHRSGMAEITNVYAIPNANCVMISGPAPADAVGNTLFLTSGQGLGQQGRILTVSNVVNNWSLLYTNTTFSPGPDGNTTYSIGYANVDSVSRLAGIFQLPETSTIQFPSGKQVFKITDSIIVDDPNATMSAVGAYTSQGYLGAGVSTPATPIEPAGLTAAQQKAIAADYYHTTPSVQTQVVVASPGPNTTYAGVFSQLAANVAANGVYNGANLTQYTGTFSVSPISQTFYTPTPTSQQTNYGVFISSVDIWFNAIPEGNSPKFPVQLSIVEVNNGIPTSNIIATSTVDFNQIAVSTTPDSINVGSLVNNNQTLTKFAFPDPVYLQPATEYAIVLYSESPDYEVYIATLGETDISTGGANGTRRISSQPSIGSFFKSQNASTWTAIPNQMLMFVLNKAQFNTQPVSFTFGIEPITNFTPYDDIILNSSDVSFSPCELTYKLLTVLANTFAPDISYTQVTPGTIWDFGQDLAISSVNSTKRRLIFPGNANSILCQISFQTQNPDLSPMFNTEMLSGIAMTNIINSGQINQENISVTNGGNHINANNIVVTIGVPDLTGGIQAKANVMVMSGNQVSFITVTDPGAGYSVAPTITISEPGAPQNATAVVAGENAPSGGNGITRYITRKIALATGMAAGDLRVYLSAIMPVGTNVLCYYKVLSATDTQAFANVPWIQMTSVNSVNSPDQLTPVALEYCPALGPNGLPSGTLSYQWNGVQYPLGGQFQYFAIKIVLYASDTTVCPVVQSMQCIAYPAG